MATADNNGIRIEYESLGPTDGPTVLLIMGLGKQLTAWHDEFCANLVDRGFRVVRFDNRDVGLSDKFHDAGVPNVLGALTTGHVPDPPYTLDDMADDAVAVLDAIEVDRAHVAGISLGGMISQAMAICHPDRVASLTSMMSTTGNPELPPGKPEAYAALLAPPASEATPEAVVERSKVVWNVLASPGYPVADEVRASWTLRDFERCYYPLGVSRQLYAILAHGDRREGLRQLEIPAMVLHGSDDPLIPVVAAEDTANTIPNAELRIIDGWGHDFPLQLIEPIADAIASVAARA